MKKAPLLPEEVIVWYIIPAIRRELTIILYKKGLKQSKIAKLLNLTNAAVSQYLKAKRATTIKFDDETLKELNKAAESILENDDLENLIRQIENVITFIKETRKICDIHSELNTNIPENCSACI